MTRREGVLAVVSLALLAGLVVGGENERGELKLAATPGPARQARPASTPSAADQRLDVDILYRRRAMEPIVDVFAQPAPLVAPAPAPVVAPVAKLDADPVPAAPPGPPALPFRLVGRFVEKGVTRVLLMEGEKEHAVVAGETLRDQYRVERITSESIEFVYLPLGVRQTLMLSPGEAPK